MASCRRFLHLLLGPLNAVPGEDAMGKVVYWMTVSLDGFVETRDGNID